MQKLAVAAATWSAKDIEILRKVRAFFNAKGILVSPNFNKMPGGGYEFEFSSRDNDKVTRILTTMYGKPSRRDPNSAWKWYKQPRTARSLEIWLSDLNGAFPQGSAIHMLYVFPRGSGI